MQITSTSLATLQKRFDQLIVQKAELTTQLEETEEYNSLLDVEAELADLIGQLKEAVKEKGDFTTKFYRFQMYDQQRVDYKEMMESLITDNKATPKYLAKFVRTISVVQAAPIKHS